MIIVKAGLASYAGLKFGDKLAAAIAKKGAESQTGIGGIFVDAVGAETAGNLYLDGHPAIVWGCRLAVGAATWFALGKVGL